MPGRKYTIDQLLDSTCNGLPTRGSTDSAWRMWGGHAVRFRLVDRSRIPEWTERLREAETEIRELRLRLEGLESGRQCGFCSGPISGRADRKYCGAACRKAGSRVSRLEP